VGLRGLATIEFLVSGKKFMFLEVNPWIQLEDTVTEQTAAVDLVAVQLPIAGGTPYYQLGLPAGNCL
jgi:pyruvate carboxylase